MEKYIHRIMEEEIPKYEGFESFCYQNCQRILLQAQGVLYPELYVNATLSLRYDLQQEQLFMGDRIRSLLPSFEESVTRTEYGAEMSAQQVFEDNCRYLRENETPIIVGVDTYYLSYASNYGKNHARHTLILCGYDWAAKEVYVVDWYPDWYYKGPVSLEELLQARGSVNPEDGTIYSGKPIGNNWACIAKVQECRPEELVKELLKVLQEEYFHSKDDDVYWGPDALCALKDAATQAEDTEFYNKNYRKITFIRKRYQFFKQYLECFAEVTSYAETAECCRILTEMIDEYDKIAMLMLKGSLMPGKRVSSKLEERLSHLIEMDCCLKKSTEKLYVDLG